MRFVDIDISKKTLEVAALDGEGEVQRRSFDNSVLGHEALVVWLKSRSAQRVVMEATGSYHQRLQQHLQAAEVPVSVVNPAQVSYFVKSQYRRNKTDQADAVLLAVYAKERASAPSPLTSFAHQSLARELNALQKDLVRLKNRLEAAESGVAHPQVCNSLKRRIAALQEEQQALEEHFEQETKQTHTRELTLLCSIPGLGVKSACLLLAEVGQISRFSTAAQLVAFAGLTPARFESGSSVLRQSSISRMGSPQLRRLLYMPSLVAVRHNPLLKRFYHHLITRGKSKKAALVACMAKLLRIVYGVLTHQRPFDPNYLTP